MPIKTKVGTSVKEVIDCKVKVNGEIKNGIELLTKINGQWKRVWKDNVIERNFYLETTSSKRVEKYYNELPTKATFRNIVIKAYDTSGALIAERTDTLEDSTGDTIILRDEWNYELGYATIGYYDASKLIRFLLTIEHKDLVAKMTLEIKAIEIN